MNEKLFSQCQYWKPNNWPSYKRDNKYINIYINSDIVEEHLEILWKDGCL